MSRLTIETMRGTWSSYGNDGRLTVEFVNNVRQQSAGTGWRARFENNPCGGDYGWGPLADTADAAIAALIAERNRD